MAGPTQNRVSDFAEKYVARLGFKIYDSHIVVDGETEPRMSVAANAIVRLRRMTGEQTSGDRYELRTDSSADGIAIYSNHLRNLIDKGVIGLPS